MLLAEVFPSPVATESHSHCISTSTRPFFISKVKIEGKRAPMSIGGVAVLRHPMQRDANSGASVGLTYGPPTAWFHPTSGRRQRQ